MPILDNVVSTERMVLSRQKKLPQCPTLPDLGRFGVVLGFRRCFEAESVGPTDPRDLRHPHANVKIGTYNVL